MLKFLESIFLGDAYNTRIRVLLINHPDDEIIDEMEMEQIHLPEDFKNINTIIVEGHEYKIVRAEPTHALQYTLSKKLTLRLNSVDVLNFRKNLNDPSADQIKFGTGNPE